MITLAIINFILDLGSRFILFIAGNLLTPLNNLTSYISAFALPQTILDVYGLVTYFLPMTTIAILLSFTVVIILLKTFVSAIHFLGFGLIFGE